MLLTKDKQFYRSLLALAIPMILQNLVTYSVGLADNLMIGSLGDAAVSGVYMGNQLQTVLQVLVGGIEAGILLLSAQYWGQRNTRQVRRVVAVGALFALAFGLLLSVLCIAFPAPILRIFTKEPAVVREGMEYLSFLSYSYVFFCITQTLIAAMRSVEVARVGLVVSLCSLVVDVALNYVFIFGKLGCPAMGVRGAALATLIARITEAVIMVVYTHCIDRRLRFRFSELLDPDGAILRDFIRYGTPLMAGQLVWGTNLLANSIILGRFSESVIAATSVANTANNLMYVGVNGLAAAVGIVIGKTVGSGHLGRIREYSRTVQLLFLCVGLLTGGMLLLIRWPLISLYSISGEAAACAGRMIGVLAVTTIGTCYQYPCLFGLVKSGGDVRFVMVNDTVFVFFVVIPAAVIASLCGASPVVVFACLKADQVLKCIPAFFKIRRYDWMKNLTRPSETGGEAGK